MTASQREKAAPTSTNTKNCTTIICCHDADNVPAKIAAGKTANKVEVPSISLLKKLVSFLSMVCLRLILTCLANVNTNLQLPLSFEDNKITICQNSTFPLCVCFYVAKLAQQREWMLKIRGNPTNDHTVK